jgi:hypothetical protein
VCVGKNVLSANTNESRVARWYIFKPKNPNLGKFGQILEGFGIDSVGLFCGHLK